MGDPKKMGPFRDSFSKVQIQLQEQTTPSSSSLKRSMEQTLEHGPWLGAGVSGYLRQ